MILNVASGGIMNRRDRRGLNIYQQSLYRSYRECEQLVLPAGGVMGEALERPSVLEAARTMALGLMRRGPSNFAKFHSDALLDEVLLHRSDDATA